MSEFSDFKSCDRPPPFSDWKPWKKHPDDPSEQYSVGMIEVRVRSGVPCSLVVSVVEPCVLGVVNIHASAASVTHAAAPATPIERVEVSVSACNGSRRVDDVAVGLGSGAWRLPRGWRLVPSVPLILDIVCQRDAVVSVILEIQRRRPS